MAMLLDPYNSQDLKKSMARRVASGPDWNAINNMAYNMPEAHNALGGTAPRRPFGSATPSTPVQAAAASPTPAPAAPQSPRVFFNPTTAETASARPAGMRELAPGVSRSEIPGVYVARGKDGSFMASNIMGADGQPEFGASLAEAATAQAMSRRSGGPVGGTEVDPREIVPNRDGWNARPGAQGGVPDPNAGQVDTNGLRGLPARATSNAGFTFANASGGRTATDVGRTIDADTNPFQVQQSAAELAAQVHADPNASNPEVAAANNQAMRRLTGAYYDRLRQFYGGNGAEASMMGATGMGGVPIPGMPGVGGTGARGGNVGTFVRDLSQAHADTANAQTNAAKAEAEAQAKQEAQNEAELQNTIKANGLDTPEAQARLQQLGLDPRSYARMQQFLEHGGNIMSSDPQTTSMRQRVQRLVMSGLMQGRGMAGAIGNALRLEHSPFIKVNDPASYPAYRISTDQFGNPTITPDGGEPVYLNSPNKLLQTTQGNSPLLRNAWNDPVLQRLIAELGQPGMSRKGTH